MPRIPQGTLFQDEPVSPTAYTLLNLANQISQAIPEIHKIQMDTQDREIAAGERTRMHERQATEDAWNAKARAQQEKEWGEADVHDFNKTWLPQLAGIEKQTAPRLATAKGGDPTGYKGAMATWKLQQDLVNRKRMLAAREKDAEGNSLGEDAITSRFPDVPMPVMDDGSESDLFDPLRLSPADASGGGYTAPTLTDTQKAMIASALEHRGAQRALGSSYERWKRMIQDNAEVGGPVGGADAAPTMPPEAPVSDVGAPTMPALALPASQSAPNLQAAAGPVGDASPVFPARPPDRTPPPFTPGSLAPRMRVEESRQRDLIGVPDKWDIPGIATVDEGFKAISGPGSVLRGLEEDPNKSTMGARATLAELHGRMRLASEAQDFQAYEKARAALLAHIENLRAIAASRAAAGG